MTIHLSSRIERASDDKRPRDTVDGIGKGPGVMPVFESNRARSNASCTDADRQNEEHAEREDLDPGHVQQRSGRCQDHWMTYNASQNSTSPYARIPRLESARKTTQKIRIQAH